MEIPSPPERKILQGRGSNWTPPSLVGGMDIFWNNTLSVSKYFIVYTQGLIQKENQRDLVNSVLLINQLIN